jgi:hypothetical protein
MSANGGDGVEILSDSKRNIVVSNSLFGNRRRGVDVSGVDPNKTSVSKNKTHGNGAEGITLDAATNGSLVANKADGNGFFADSTAQPIDDNTGLGINAPTGTPGCGNKGKDNDNTLEIVPSKLKKKC